MKLLQLIANFLGLALRNLRLNLLNQICPIGSIIPYHQSLFTTPPILPANWIVCNGQTINNSNSPLNGKITINMGTNNRILRGHNTTSGTLSTNTVKSGAGFSYYTVDMIFIMRIY